MKKIPELRTERLILRGMTKADFPVYAAVWQEPEVVRFIGGKPRSEVESWQRFLRGAGSWVIDGFGQWAITRKADGGFLGMVGFFNAMRGIGADFDAAPEAGWSLRAAAQGQGYGREAAVAAHDWFDAQPFGGRSHAMIDIGHAVSFGLAERLGYVPLRETEYEGDRVMLMVRQRVLGDPPAL